MGFSSEMSIFQPAKKGTRPSHPVAPTRPEGTGPEMAEGTIALSISEQSYGLMADRMCRIPGMTSVTIPVHIAGASPRYLSVDVWTN